MSFCEVVETKMFAKFVGIILYFFLVGTTHGKVIGEVQDVSQSIEEYGQIAPLEHTDEEIIAATTFMTLAPVTTDSDKIKDLMIDLCNVLNKNKTGAKLPPVVQQTQTDTLQNDNAANVVPTMSQFWGSEMIPSAITNANISSLKKMCSDVAAQLIVTAKKD